MINVDFRYLCHSGQQQQWRGSCQVGCHLRVAGVQLPEATEGGSCRNIPNVEVARTPVKKRTIPPWRSRSMSAVVLETGTIVGGER
jgi:hypothetical protein